MALAGKYHQYGPVLTGHKQIPRWVRTAGTGTKMTWNKHTTEPNIFGLLNDVTFDFSGSLINKYHWLNK